MLIVDSPQKKPHKLIWRCRGPHHDEVNINTPRKSLQAQATIEKFLAGTDPESDIYPGNRKSPFYRL